MRALPLLLLLATAAQGQGFGWLEEDGRIHAGGLGNAFLTATEELPVLQFAPAAGTGLQSVADLCDTYSTDMTGAFFCLRGDGTSLSGSQTLTAIAAPTTASSALCPNGTDCTAVTSVRFDGSTQKYETANAASPTGDFSACAVFSSEDHTVNPPLVTKDDGATRVFYLRQAADNGAGGCVLKAGGGNTCVATASATAPNFAWNFACLTYDYVTDGTSILTPYNNGAVGTASTTAVGPPATGSSKFTIANFAFSAFKGRIRNAFYTEKVLTPATIAAMARTALADVPTGSAGEALTFTRTSTRFCTNAAGSAGSWLPVNRPCITGGGINIEGARTNIVFYSKDLDNANWVKFNGGGASATTVTANTTDVAAPDGTFTAEKVVFPAVSGAGAYSVFAKNSIPNSNAAYTGSIYMRTLSGTVDFYQYFFMTGPTFYSTRCTATTTWSRCVNPNRTLPIAAFFAYGTDLQTGTDQTSTTGGTVYLWQSQAELGGFASSTIVTAGTSVTRSADDASFVMPTGMSDTAGCVAATVLVPGWDANLPGRVFGTAGAATPMYINAATTFGSYDGTNFGISASGAIVNVSTRIASGWAGAVLTFNRGGSRTTAVYDGSFPLGATMPLGQGGTAYLFGTMSAVQFGRTTGACQ